ncbi:MAG TPA: STAS domain-containing protein [Micromonosporaceae bacterium]
MNEIHCRVETTLPVAVVRLEGVLGLDSASTVRTALLKRLAEHPDALIVDLSRLTVADESALSVFVAVARQAAIWPGIAMALCGVPERFAAIASRLVPVCDDPGQARDVLRRVPVPLQRDRRLLPVTGSARRARDLATEACLDWGLSDLVIPSCVVAGELVANAVQHAGTPMTLSFRRLPRYLHIAVRDGSDRPALRCETHPLALGGRGLMIVDATSRCWGCSPATGGKVVWATLDVGDPWHGDR